MVYPYLRRGLQKLMNHSYKQFTSVFNGIPRVSFNVSYPSMNVQSLKLNHKGTLANRLFLRPFSHGAPCISGSFHNTNRRRKQYLLYYSFTLPFFSYFFGEEKEESEIVKTIKYAILATQREEYDKAEQILHVSLKLAQEMDDEKAVTYIYDQMANVAYQRKEYSKAETLFVDVLKRLLQDGMADDDNAVVEVSLKLASIYSYQGHLEKADLGFKFCIETQDSKLKSEGEENVDEDTLVLWAMSHDWYARFLLSLHHYDSAKDHFFRAYDVCVQVKGLNDPQTAVLLNDIGSVASLQQKYDEAERYIKEAIRIGHITESEDLASFYVNLGVVYLQKKVLEEAEKFCNKGLKIAKAEENEEVVNESSICLETLRKLRST